MRLKGCYRPILLPRTAAFLPRRCWGFSAWFLRDLPLRCLPPDGGEVAEIRAPLPLRHFRLPDVLRVRLPSVCAAVFLMKHGLSEALLTQYSAYFLMPPLVLFWIFFFVLVMTQIVAFRKGLTPYRCCVFSMAFGMLVYFLAALLGNRPLGNALRCAWLAIGNVWMFGGLLVTMKKAQRA